MKKIVIVAIVIIIVITFFVNGKPKISNTTYDTKDYYNNEILNELREQQDISKRQNELLEQILREQQSQEKQLDTVEKQTKLLEEISAKQQEQITFLSSIDSYLQSIDRNIP
ncbi:hypothetical protein ACTAZI_15620 [Legionella bozemanae]|uniref:hypothetical protein n=1 Tax=Legionella bozemanae TaxID=447 RepID=UPI003EEE5A77